jgi:hypothetical protein
MKPLHLRISEANLENMPALLRQYERVSLGNLESVFSSATAQAVPEFPVQARC